MLKSVEHHGLLVGDHGLAGVRERENVFPAHPCGLQLAADRWLLLSSPRALRQHDDDRAIIYQLRADSPVGNLIKEGFLYPPDDAFDPDGDGSHCVCLLRHPKGFGVPRGALVGGRRVPHENRFVVHFTRSAAGKVAAATGLYAYDAQLERRTLHGMWCQFRLNDAGDDITMLQTPRLLRELGYETGADLCRHPGATTLITGLVPPVPWNREKSEWVAASHLTTGLAVMKYRFNAATGLYEWVETGPCVTGSAEYTLSEPLLARAGGAWITCVRVRVDDPNMPVAWDGSRWRDRGHTGWIRVADPFREFPFPTIVKDAPPRQGPSTLFTCADGVLRRLPAIS